MQPVSEHEKTVNVIPLKRDAQFWLRIVLVIAVVFTVYYVPWIVVPFLFGLFLCLILRPLVEFQMKVAQKLRWHWFPVDIAIIIAFLVFIAVMTILVRSIFVPFWHQFEGFVLQIPSLTSQLLETMQSLQARYIDFIPPEAQEMINDSLVRAGNYLIDVAKNGIFAVIAFTGTLVELVVVPIITFYMLKAGSTFKRIFAELFPPEYRQHIMDLVQETDHILSAYIRGQLILCVAIASMVFVGMWWLEVPYPLVIALLAGIVELVPIVGPIVGAIPALLLALTISGALAVKVLIFYIIVQQFDGHILMPKLMGNVIEIHPVAIIAGVLLGSAVLGVFGMMLAVPTLAVLKVITKHMWYYNKYREIARS